MNQKAKAILIVAFSILGFAFLNTHLAIDAAMITSYALFESRQSNLETLNSKAYRIYKCRKDFDSLQNREEFTFNSGNNTLMAYSYKPASPKAKVFCFHGMNGLSDGNDAIYQNWFYQEGYHVIAVDLSSCGASTANPHMGPCQAPIDVSNAVKACEERFPSEIDLPYYLVGHSLGGYGVAASLHYGTQPKGIITFSAFDTPLDEMFSVAKQRIGPIADLTRFTFDLGMHIKYGNMPDLSAKNEILQANEVASLHFYGDQDNRVLKPESLYGALENTGKPNISTHLLSGIGHEAPWVDASCHPYIDTIKKDIATLQGKKLEDYLSTVDKEKTSKFSSEVDSVLRSFLNE